MNTELLKKKILQLAMQGKMVEQDESDGTADELIDQILEEKKKLMYEGKIKKEKLSRIYKNPTDNHYYEKFDDGKITDISNLIHFEIPENWEWIRLNTILSVKGGKRIPKGYSFSKNVTDHIYIRVSDMKNNTITKQDIKYISNEVFEKIKNYTISKNDLYLTIAGTIGKVGIVPDYFDNMNLTENAVKLTNINFIDKKYLMYCINSDFIQEQFSDKTTQVAQPKLAIKRIETTIIPVPPLQEQSKIVNGIEKLISKINQIEESFYIINTNKKLLKTKLIDLAIKGKLTKQLSSDEPSSKLIENIIEEKHKLMAEGKIKKENLSIIYKDSDNQFYEKFDDGKVVNITDEVSINLPQKWSYIRLTNIIELISGRDLSIGEYNNQKKGIPYITGASNFEKNYLKINRWTEQPKVLAYMNDLLLTCKGTIGTTTILKEEKVHIARQIMALRKYDTVILTDYLKLFIDSHINNLRKKAKGLIPGISREDILNIIIPLPPLDEQKRIISQIQQLLNIL